MEIRFEEASYRYGDGRSGAVGLDRLRLSIASGSFTVVLGAPGSGKSTLLQHMNGLLLPSDGAVQVGGTRLEAEPGSGRLRAAAGVRTMGDGGTAPGSRGERREAAARSGWRARRAHAKAQAKSLQEVRRRVGLVFQFPEKQLFEETVLQDIAFGPLNFGMSAAEAEEAARRAAAAVELDEELLARSPFELSGGQLRKAAIASVLAAGPEVIALDEPTASLDQQSRAELMALLQRLCRDQGATIVIVTHRLEEALPYGDTFVVMSGGRTIFEGTAAELLRRPEVLETAGIVVPPSMIMLRKLSERLGAPLPQTGMDARRAAAWIAEAWERREGSLR